MQSAAALTIIKNVWWPIFTVTSFNPVYPRPFQSWQLKVSAKERVSTEINEANKKVIKVNKVTKN